MSAIDRPSWCQDATCRCLTGYNELVCVGRLSQAVPDPDHPDDIHGEILLNTHHLCLDRDVLLVINDEDAYCFMRCLQAVRADVETNGLYRPPGRGETWELGGQKS